MEQIARDITELVGRTPLLEAARFGKARGLTCRLLTKLEYLNPAGSVKDRVALWMIREGERAGALAPGATIIEPTSGNTGIGLAAIGAARGYRVILTMPETMSKERRDLLKAYGAEIVLTEGAKGMAGAIAKAEELAASIPGSFVPGQFDNPANPQAHYDTTGPEIWEQTEGALDLFVAGTGTGGTLTGTGRFLKEKKPEIRIVGVEPAGSPVLTQGKSGPHGLQGMGAGFIPKVLDTTLYDQMLTCTEEQAYAAAREFAKTEGILVGISSGAALWAASEVGSQPENAGKTVVVLLPDTGDRYLSTPLFGE
ncbi:cysteine synthase [Clostridium sp. CAG:1013]|nr:cysteine synthase [Clostridium sp. CAG:1013]